MFKAYSLNLITYGLIAVLTLVFLIWLIYPEKQSPQSAPEVQVTFPEGFTVKQIQDRLAANNLVFELDENLEGYLFPDTYRFYKNSTAEQAIKKMQDNFNAKVGEISYDDLILASIVQKEVSNQEDMKKVAGIFLKRLKVNMPLQSDATINFITGKNLTQPSIKDTKTASPYNTYLNLGLPLAPICNPGLTAIEAVQNPEESAYWYFLTPPDIPTIYSKSLEEHNAAKAKFLTSKN
ncbi:MAG: endolytic transglycosylase MltG [bacterium]